MSRTVRIRVLLVPTFHFQDTVTYVTPYGPLAPAADQLPSHPSHMRVKTWRCLQQIGAVSTRNSLYVLPNTEPCREDFEWIRSEIVALGGEATVFSADSLDASGGEDIVATFHRARATRRAKSPRRRVR